VSGVPKFKKKGKDDSFTLDGSISVGFNHIKLPRIGWMKTYEVLPDNVAPKSVTISRKADRWFVSFKVERECQITEKAVDVVGVDY
jgi:putative transposase